MQPAVSVVCWSRESLVEQARLAVTDQPQRALKSLPKAPAITVTSVYKSTTTMSNKLPVYRKLHPNFREFPFHAIR